MPPTSPRGTPSSSPPSLAFSLATTRARLRAPRRGFWAASREELLGALGSLAEGGPPLQTLRSHARAKEGKLAYLLTGQGAQRPQMGKELYEAHPGLSRRPWMQICDLLFDQEAGASPSKTSSSPRRAQRRPSLHSTRPQVHPALSLLATEVALSIPAAPSLPGLEADLLVGHSIGEIAAAHISGVHSIYQDACQAGRGKGRT